MGHVNVIIDVTPKFFHLAEFHCNLYRISFIRYQYISSHKQRFNKEFVNLIFTYSRLKHSVAVYNYSVFFFKQGFCCNLYTAFQHLKFFEEICRDTFYKMQFLIKCFTNMQCQLKISDQAFSDVLNMYKLSGYYLKDLHYNSAYTPCAVSHADVVFLRFFQSSLHIFKGHFLFQI